MINENGDERNAGKGKIYWWNMEIEWSEIVKVKQSEMRWNNEFLKNAEWVPIFIYLFIYFFRKGNGKYRVSEASDFHPVFFI